MTWIANSATRSTSAPACSVREARSELDHILLVVVRILFKVADRGGVRRLLLREVFEQIKFLVFDLGDVDVENAVMRRRVNADAGFERFDHFQSVYAFGLLHAVRPKVETLVGPHR